MFTATVGDSTISLLLIATVVLAEPVVVVLGSAAAVLVAASGVSTVALGCEEQSEPVANCVDIGEKVWKVWFGTTECVHPVLDVVEELPIIELKRLKEEVLLSIGVGEHIHGCVDVVVDSRCM